MRDLGVVVAAEQELYDAFGEDYEDADEETGLRRHFHPGFLEDENPPSATASVLYKDELGEREHTNLHEQTDPRSGSPESGDDGSWEHASQQARRADWRGSWALHSKHTPIHLK